MSITAAAPAGYRIAEIPTEGVSDDVLGQVTALWRAIDAEAIPEDPQRPLESYAGSNAPMLRINDAMGFKPAWESILWQAPLAAVQKYVRA